MSTNEPKENAGDNLLVKDVAFTKKGQVSITLQSGEEFLISEQAYLSSFVYPGKRFSAPEWATLLAISAESLARTYVERLLLRRLYAPGEVMQKLLRVKKLDYKSANLLVEKLKKEGLLNEEDYAREYAGELQTKGYASAGVRQALRQKAISEEIIAKVLDEAKSFDPQAALALLSRVCRQHTNDSARMLTTRLRLKLLKLGYSAAQTDQALGLLESERGESVTGDREERVLPTIAATLYARLEKQDISGPKKKERFYKSLLAKGFRSVDIDALMTKEDYRFD